MSTRLQHWIVRSIDAGGFSARRHVLWFAFTRSVVTTAAAVVLNFVVYQIFGRLEVLHVTIPTHPWADAVVTALIAAPLCFLAYFMMGHAIRELSISRDAFARLSRLDPLTGLLNRRAFTEAVEGMAAPYVIAVVDIDRFKAVNDTFGHAAGDKVLVEVSKELRDAFGPETILARLGGEEFGIAMPDHGQQASLAVLDKARARLALRLFDIAGARISVTFSAGVSRSGGQQGYSALMIDADKALYLAKAAGRNRVVHFDDIAAIELPAERTTRQLAG